MSRRDEILRNIERIERGIEALEDYRFELEANYRPAGDRIRLWRVINIFLTLRQIDRQVYGLRLRLNAARNCYRQIQGREARGTVKSGR